MGQDRRWRRALTKSLSLQPGMHVLDVATGTGDQLISLAHASENLQLTGIDVCEAMLIADRHAFYREAIRVLTNDGTLAVMEFINPRHSPKKSSRFPRNNRFLLIS